MIKKFMVNDPALSDTLAVHCWGIKLQILSEDAVLEEHLSFTFAHRCVEVVLRIE